MRGSHIVVDKRLTRGVYYMEAPSDRRAVFAMPWGQHTLVGTTEILHRHGPDHIVASEEEIHYLRDTLSHFFPGPQPELLDAWAGLRVLPRSNDIANKRLRDTFLFCDNEASPQMLSVYGGKLTAYRHTAERVVRLLSRRLGPRDPQADTRNTHLAARK